MDSPRRVLFLDLYCPEPYDSLTSFERAQGGTESTVARVAEGLSEAGYEVTVAQHNRKGPGRGKALYCSVDTLGGLPTPHYSVCLRTPQAVPWVQAKLGGKVFLWCHDESYNELVAHHEILAEAKTKLIGVSRYHKQAIQDAFLSQSSRFPGITVDYVYNPVADDLVPDETEWEVGIFVFFSSPHKGLELTLKQWEHIRNHFPAANLLVANPGYYSSDLELPPGVVDVGKLSHPDVIQLVRRAEAVLHLNSSYPETFGIVHAEANAVGTPVLTSGIGANREVLNPYRDQVVDVTSIEAILRRLDKWHKEGRPKVSCRAEFRQSAVIEKWKGLFKHADN